MASDAETFQSHISHFALKVGGQAIPEEAMNALLDCTIENSVHLPDVCTIRLHDYDFRWLDQQTFAEGKSIEVRGSEGDRGDQGHILFQGEVVGNDLDMSAHGVPTLTVRCFDKSHRLHRGRLSRSFQQVKDTDIVRKVAGDAGFQVDADQTTEVHKWVLQNNQTNWEFLQQRAAYNGFRLWVAGDKLYFRKVQDNVQDAVPMEWGMGLRSFRPRTSASPQVDEVVVRGWDPGQKQAIVGRASSGTGVPQIGGNNQGGAVARQAYGQAKMVVVDRPIHTQGEADDLARSVFDDIAGAFVEAEGLCYGVPQLRPNMMVQIRNIGERFSGKYQVTSTTHTFTPAEGYSTIFTVSGKRASTVLSSVHGDDLSRRAPLGGNVVVGIVTDNNDPENLARVKVKYPWLTEDHESYWARIAAPDAGPNRGFNFLPEINDEVLVAFEHGDIRRPYVIGRLWNGQDAPASVYEDNPEYKTSQCVSSGKVYRRVLRSRMGYVIVMHDDDSDGGLMRFASPETHEVCLSDEHKSIRLLTAKRHVIWMNDKDNYIDIRDNQGNYIKIDANNNSVTVSCQGPVSVDAGGNVTVTAGGDIDVKGTNITVKADGTMDLEATGNMTIKGALVKIN